MERTAGTFSLFDDKMPGNGPVHREVLAIPGVMKRTECNDAERALDALRKRGAITAIAQARQHCSNTKGLKHEPERKIH